MERLQDELFSLCEVLGADYLEKLDLLGIVPGEEIPAEARQKQHDKLSKMVEFMAEAKQERFPQFQAVAKKLIEMWSYHKTPAAKILPFEEVFVLVDAINADEMTGPKSLSSSAKKKIERELALLEAAKYEKLKKKYLIRKEKLLNLIQKTHLVPSDFGYDPKRKVEADELKTETKAIKQMIKLVKAQILLRKDLVLRIEMIQHHVSLNRDAGKINELIKVARCQLDKFLATEDAFMFEGQDLSVYLEHLEADADERQVQESVDANNKIKASLRSHPKQGRTPRVPI